VTQISGDQLSFFAVILDMTNFQVSFCTTYADVTTTVKSLSDLSANGAVTTSSFKALEDMCDSLTTSHTAGESSDEVDNSMGSDTTPSSCNSAAISVHKDSEMLKVNVFTAVVVLNDPSDCSEVL